MFSAWLLAGASFHLVATTSTVQSHVCQAVTPPSITQPSSGQTTKNSSVVVKGSADTNTSVSILDDGHTAATTTSDSAGAYQISTPLHKGDNTLLARAHNPCGDTADSSPVTVKYMPPPNPPQPPQPQPSGGGSSGSGSTGGGTSSPTGNGSSSPSSSPKEPAGTRHRQPPSSAHRATSGPLTLWVQEPGSSTTREPSIVIEGATNQVATITISIGGRRLAQVATDQSGYFQVRVPLSIGANELTISASAQGHTAKVRLHIVRESTVPSPSFWHRYGRLILIVVIVALVLLAAAAGLLWKKNRGTWA